MKNLTIKKVALGLFLAGYAASSAFALDATTSSVINGNAPVLKAIDSTAVEHTLTVRVTTDEAGTNPIGQRAAKVGDYVVIQFRLEDADGDTDGGQIKETLKVFARKASGWETINKNNIGVTEARNGTTARVSFKITSDFLGAEKIGFKLLERTDFGVPYTNKWLEINDIWAAGNPHAAPTNPADPTAPPSDSSRPNDPIADSNAANSDHGPGDTIADNGHGPITTDDVEIGIFKVDGNGNVDKNVNYALSSAPAPKYGETFQAIVWTDGNIGDGVRDANATDLTGYTFVWTLDGSYEGVDATAAKLDEVQDHPEQIVLGPNNSIYNSAYKAGAQGYNLKVTATLN
ncbi:hypothetical protein [Gilliamella sp. Pas-s25]|uniref:hypothetical protein n=1 Tax=Gilliamella sp. Pas-s25 TaxID=2687310 RepID=UPI00135DC66D|nr:hypothetical protein [Gilliamella sp. Pas-s25]MWP61476.1 hypothetical protein [Gilliamella sp. Pas-s25]